MFQGFSDKTSEFFWGLALNNDRAWFQANRETFEAALNRPFRALAGETLALMEQRHPESDFSLHIARIYRDARRLYGRGPFKENLWFTLQRGERLPGGPVFWFELDGRTWSYGAGCWDSGADQSAAWREAIDAEPARFEAIVDGLAARDGLRLWGEAYKRPKGDRGVKLNPWYNRRHVSVGWEHPFGGALYTDALPGLLADAFDRLTPLYDFSMEVFLRVQAERAALRALSLSGEAAPE